MIDAFVSVGIGVSGDDALSAPLFRVVLERLSLEEDGASWGFDVSPAVRAEQLERGIVDKDKRAGWFYSGGGAQSHLVKRDGVWVVHVSSMMAYVHRVLGGMLDGFGGAPAHVRVRLVNKVGRHVQFTTSLSLGLAFPGSFRYEFVEQTVNDFCSPHVPVPGDSHDLGVAGDVVAFSDEVAGDVATCDGASLNTSPTDLADCDLLRPLDSFPVSSLPVLWDVTLARAESGVAKLRWVGDYVCGFLDPGGSVLVGGDHPGTLSRRLMSRGMRVTGADPRNDIVTERSLPGPGGGGVYHRTRDRVSVGTLLDDFGHDWGGVVFDVAVDRHSAESDTAVNCGAAAVMRDAGVKVCIAKTRSAPRVPGDWYVLDNPGWEVRGCEAYLQAVVSDEWPDGASCRVRVLEDGRIFALPRPSGPPPWWDAFFVRHKDMLGEVWVVPERHWYHFITLRACDHARRRSEFGLGAELRSARTAVDAWLGLRAWLGSVDPAVRADVANRFRSDEPVGARGVPREVLQRSPGLLGAMAGRYQTLLSVCQDPGAPCPPELALIMKHPGAGCLLADLSQLRSLLGEGQVALADYSRVLPWGAMGILGSDLFFRMFYWLSLCTARFYKPFHSWELQHRLWCLSSFGTDEERFLYLFDCFERIFSGVDQARGAGRKAGTVERCYRRFEENLATLGLRDAYLQFDRPYSLLVAQRAQPHRRRAVHAARGAASVVPLTEDGSLQSSSAPGGNAPIVDLADFGISAGWGPATTLHTVLAATRGRVSQERAYAYWCNLSPVTRPREISRARWAPRIKLNTQVALRFGLPGLSSPEAFVAVRDEQLGTLREQLQ
ncbi:hypothetical protein [Fusarium solani alternavirus 1]|nr:hypothetical protein [Fusarium solani alternavirus 1]